MPVQMLIVSETYQNGQRERMSTVRKMDLILRPIERRPQMQFSMVRRFKLQLLRRERKVL